MMTPLTEKLATGLLGAVLAGGGATVVNNWHTNAVQDAEIEQMRVRQQKVEQLLDTLNETNTKIALLNQRLDWIEGSDPAEVRP